MAQVIVLLSYNLLLLMGFYSFVRLFFLAYHWSKYLTVSKVEIAFAFLHGLRFDFSTIVLINSPIILLALFLGLQKNSLKLIPYLRWPFVVINSLFFVTAMGDVEYINFTGRRLTKDVLFMSRELGHQVFQILQYYWFNTFVLILLIGLLTRTVRFKLPQIQLSKKHISLITLLFLLCIFIGARGGWQLKPLQANHAFAHSTTAVGELTLNSNFTFLKSKLRTPLQRKNYFSKDSEALEVLNKNQLKVGLTNKLPSLKGQNVMIIVLESFALEYLIGVNNQSGYTPFLKDLSKKSLYFQNGFANGRRSIEAIPSILSATPSLLSQPLITSDFQSNQFIGIGNIFLDQGYTTHFFHGGENGTMFFDSFSSRVGFENYYGYNEYPNKDKDFDGNWGIYDEPFFMYTIKTLNQVRKPFLSLLFSLSSHQPYSIPPHLKGHFPKGNLEIHESLGYTDYALKIFFESAKKTDWYHNTLFVITADHTQKSEGGSFADDLGAYRVPIMFFHPSVTWPEINAQKVMQHADIAPTILDLMQIPSVKLPSLGRSIFKSEQGLAINFTGSEYWLLSDRFFIKWNEESLPSVYKHTHSYDLKPIPDSSLVQQDMEYLKALLQIYYNGLISNNLYTKENKEL
ncbi:MAG: sulfatase-like hydrolase/transferase [Bdellovibrionaceae bacterium]|nr:sulfatase-like hydrolase/transferase [Pseudobdellovibrionaceae bacterium]